MADLHDVLVRPLITEKSSAAWQERKEYVFHVHPDATKQQIREALKAALRGDGDRRCAPCRCGARRRREGRAAASPGGGRRPS